MFTSKIIRYINLNAVRVGKGGRWKIDVKYVTGVCVELYFTKMWWRYDVVYTHTFISVHSIKKSKHKWINLTYIREGPCIRYLSIVIYWELNPKRSHTWPFCYQHFTSKLLALKCIKANNMDNKSSNENNGFLRSINFSTNFYAKMQLHPSSET